MALWNGIGQVASVAQLAGVDASGLITMILEAARTVRRNKETCRKLARRAEMIGDLLQQLHEAQLMQHPDTRNPVEQLEEALRRAFMLIAACQDSSFMNHCFTGGRRACRLREVEDDIVFYLRLFPLVGHVDTTRTLVRHLNGDQPSGPEVSAGGTEIPKSHSGHAPRLEDAEKVESRLQGVNKPSTQKKEQLSRSNFFYSLRKRNMKGHVNKDMLVKLFCSERHSRLSPFSFSQVLAFTENFKCENLIGCGAFGNVYKGRLPNGSEIAAKRFITSSAQGSEEFNAEIEIIPNLQHKNVVRLLGFCIQRKKVLGFHVKGEEMILIYEYMPNKSLDSFLYSYTKSGEALNWSVRFHIIEGLAHGLVYLHEHSHQCVVHMDLKASNVLLDCELNPKISDFGMARILASSGTEETSNIIKGTCGYMDPEYIRTGKFSVKSDVYSFGVMILEIVSRKRYMTLLPNGDMMDVSTCAWELWKAGKSHLLVDSSSLCNEHQKTQIIRCIHVALLCIQDCPMNRPTMLDVLVMLRSESVSIPIPKAPQNHAECM